MISLSIVTVTYNAEEYLDYAFTSLYKQDVPFEHIVIDGGSTDKTTNIIERYHEKITYTISENDLGIYDALNKGISKASGDVIGILHSDDFYFSDKVLKTVVNTFENDSIDACYGDLIYVKKDKCTSVDNPVCAQDFQIHRFWKSGHYNKYSFYLGWMPPHPTLFIKRSVYEKYGLFDLAMGTAADYEIILRFLLKHKIICKYIPEILVCMRAGGVSNKSFVNRAKANYMDYKAWKLNGFRSHPCTILLKVIRKIPQFLMRP